MFFYTYSIDIEVLYNLVDIGTDWSVGSCRHSGKAARTQLSKYNCIKLCYKCTIHDTYKDLMIVQTYVRNPESIPNYF